MVRARALAVSLLAFGVLIHLFRSLKTAKSSESAPQYDMSEETKVHIAPERFVKLYKASYQKGATVEIICVSTKFQGGGRHPAPREHTHGQMWDTLSTICALPGCRSQAQDPPVDLRANTLTFQLVA